MFKNQILFFFLWLVGKQNLWFAVFWQAVVFQRDFRPKAGQKTEWCRRSEFLRGWVFFCVTIFWRQSFVQVKMFSPFSQWVSWKPQRYWNASELFINWKRRYFSSLDSWVALDLVLDINILSLLYIHSGNFSWSRSTVLNRPGGSEIQQGTGASFKFQPIDKLTPPHERSCRHWSFDQVWYF